MMEANIVLLIFSLTIFIFFKKKKKIVKRLLAYAKD
jgi:hypothetical protein